MRDLQKWLQRNFYGVLMLLLAGGFVMVLVELLITDHTDGTQLVGVVASGVGVVLTLAALFVGGSARRIVAGLLLVLSLTGVLGTWEHFEEGREGGEAMRPAAVALANQPASFQLDEDENEEQEAAGESEGEAVPPPLAPLSLAGLSLMAALVILGTPEKSAP
jgi:hypothetical protein